MKIGRYSRGAALAVCLVIAPAVAQSPSPPDDGSAGSSTPMPLTTDTEDYCLRLATEVENSGKATDEMRALVTEGRRMCVTGRVVAGVSRVRKAFVLMRGVTVQR
ncbi:MAG TPA: hypothetical protein VHS58_09575 [Acetobacteraceae bacterium]|jgi:hypothetical protein|nr:hypothetical protein [Acetobacteraceae bacterium]